MSAQQAECTCTRRALNTSQPRQGVYVVKEGQDRLVSRRANHNINDVIQESEI